MPRGAWCVPTRGACAAALTSRPACWPRPRVLFLDEPTTGLDPRGRLALWQVLSELTSRGTGLLLTTQYIEEAERLAGMIVIIDHGKVIASGTPGQLRARAGGDRLDLAVLARPGPPPAGRCAGHPRHRTAGCR